MDFSSCWQDLGFAGCFFFLNFNSKSIEKLLFLAFGKILVLLLLVFFGSIPFVKAFEISQIEYSDRKSIRL